MRNLALGTCVISLLCPMAGACGSVAHDKGLAEPRAAVTADAKGAGVQDASVIALAALRRDTASYDWFEFKPGVRKLILSGTPDSRHVSVLWYGYEGKPGSVPLHYHEKTEAIFVIAGAQSDAKGTYGEGSFYFNPPGSGHAISDSAGLFLLAYAAPPNFARAADSKAYENLTVGADYKNLPLAPCADGSLCYALPLAAEGGMEGRFVRPRGDAVTLTANVILVLEGSCAVAGQNLAADTLVVGKSAEPANYPVTAAAPDCLIYTLAFL